MQESFLAVEDDRQKLAEYGGGFEHLGRFELNTFVAVN